jgi:hypothetical protein
MDLIVLDPFIGNMNPAFSPQTPITELLLGAYARCSQ